MRFLGLAMLVWTWLGLFFLSRELAIRERFPAGWRWSVLGAALSWAALVAATVEGASFFRQLNGVTLAILWTGWAVVAGWAAAWLARQRGASLVSETRHAFARRWRAWDTEWPASRKLLLGGCALMAALTFVIALVTPTTNWDSLAYHLPRVQHWLQQHSVEHFPTNNTRQIEFAPWSAFLVATLQLFTGGDRFANLVQWSAMVLAAIGVSLIAEQLWSWRAAPTPSGGTPVSVADPRWRIGLLAAFLALTIPIGVAQSVSTQTDWVVTGWLVGLVAGAGVLITRPEIELHALIVGLAAGLGLLSKATMFVYAAPLGLGLIAWWLVKMPGWAGRLRVATVVAIAILALNGPHWLRNQRVFGSPLGSKHILEVERNGSFSVSGTFSNVIRNLLLETNTGIPPLTDLLNRVLLAAHRLTGRDLNDPATSYYLGNFEVAHQFDVRDSEAANPWHVGLILLTLVLLSAAPRAHARWLGYAALWIGGFVLFCALLRWQRWHTRIHLGFLVALMPVVAAVIAGRKRPWLAYASALLTGSFALICLGANRSRPVLDPNFTSLPREAQYTAAHGFGVYDADRKIAEEIILSGAREVGLKLGFDDAEFPLWVLLRNRGFSGRLQHVAVENESSRLPVNLPAPEVVICSAPALPAELQRQFPYKLDYGLARVHWSAGASRWSRLEWFDADGQTSLVMSASVTRVPLRNRLAGFYFRSPRPGTLRFQALVTDGQGHAVQGNRLRAWAYGGWENNLALNGQPVMLAVPVTGGTTRISWAVLEPPADGDATLNLTQLAWSWEPLK